MTELQTFLAMLDRAGISHEIRRDSSSPTGPGTGVIIGYGCGYGGVSEWWFDDDGRLLSVYISEG